LRALAKASAEDLQHEREGSHGLIIAPELMDWVGFGPEAAS
jgi:hypothetical protein